MRTSEFTFDQVSKMTVPELFQHRVAETPDVLAVRSVQGNLTFGGWAAQAASIAHLLLENLGDLHGERIAIWMTNDEATSYVSALQATFNVGGISVSLDDRITVTEARRIFEECEPAALIIGPQVAQRLGGDELAALGISGWNANGGKWSAAIAPLKGDGEAAPWLWISDPNSGATWDRRVAEPGDNALIAYTSGSSGTPKGAVWTQSAICQYAERVANATYAVPRNGKPLGETDVLQSPIPLYTAASLIENIYPAVFAGCTLIFEGRRFDAEASGKRMATFGTTVYNGVPPHFAKMCELPQRREGTAPELMVTSGSAITPDLYRRMSARWPSTSIANWYGLNESGTGQTINHGKEMDRYPGSVGRPLPPTEIRVVDGEFNDVDPGSEGVLLMRAPGQMHEYFRNPDQTAMRFHGDWLITGDRVTIDDTGLIHVVGRTEERINRGGFKFYPAEIEGILEEHEAVREAAVIAVAHPVLGQDAIAFVVASTSNVKIDEQALRAHCRAQVAPNKVPAKVIFVEAFPRSAYGKVIRRDLVALYEEQRQLSA